MNIDTYKQQNSSYNKDIYYNFNTMQYILHIYTILTIRNSIVSIGFLSHLLEDILWSH